MGVSVTNGFNFGTGGTNPGYFNSNSFQLANDLDWMHGRHQVSFGGNWIHTRIETVNNRPSNGQFTFNGQTTGLGLADFMLGRMSSFVQGNPVYDFDHNDYIGAYVQDEWKLRTNLTRQRRPALGAVPADQEHARATSATSTWRASTPASAARSIRRRLPASISPAIPASRATRR